MDVIGENMKSTSQIKLVYTLTCLALVPIFALSAYYIYHSRQVAVKEKIKKIHEIAKSKQVTLETHLDNYIKSLNSFSKNESFIEAFKTNNFENGAYDTLKNFQEEMWGASHHIFVADTKGHIVLSPHHKTNKKSTHLHHSIAKSKYFSRSLVETQVTDFYGFEESTHYHQLVMVPIKYQGKTLGVIISEITTQHLFDLLKEDFELGKTGQVYLATLDKKKVVHLKKDEIKDVTAPLMQQALKAGSQFGENESFGTTVLASYLKSKRFPWVLAVEISKDEVLAPINKMTKIITFAYGAFVLLFLFVFRYIVKMLKKPVQEISKTIEEISTGAIENSLQMKQSTSGLIDGSMKLSEALIENQGQLEKVVDDIKTESQAIQGSAQRSLEAKNIANKGETIVNEMTNNIDLSCQQNINVQVQVSKVLKDITKIGNSIKLIQEKTQLINDIVFQTKLLSFNASVEAARAGEHGKGFAVVAEEVGNLAAMSGKASDEIHHMIEESVEQVEKIVKASSENLKQAINVSSEKIEKTKDSIDNCRDIFLDIINSINEINDTISDVSQKSKEKVFAIDEVNERFISLKLVSEQSTAVANTVGRLTSKLENDSNELGKVSQDLSKKFAA